MRPLGSACRFPLVKRICGDQASAKSKGIAEGRLRGRCFRSCVDHSGRARGVLSPMRNQTPAHQRQLSNRFLWMLADYGNGLGGCDIEAWRPAVFPRRRVEILLDELFSARQPVATAHDRKFIADSTLYFAADANTLRFIPTVRIPREGPPFAASALWLALAALADTKLRPHQYGYAMPLSVCTELKPVYRRPLTMFMDDATDRADRAADCATWTKAAVSTSTRYRGKHLSSWGGSLPPRR